MLFMNEHEITVAAGRNYPGTLGKATRFLAQFCAEVNQHSDGWPYWSPPVKAAAKLMTLIQNGEAAFRGDVRGSAIPPTEVDLTAAIAPIKAFYTRRGKAAGMRFPTGA